MKLKPIITHTFIFAAGSILTAAYFLLVFVPSIASHIPADSLQIKLSESKAPEEYHPILEKDFLGGLYLRNPLYFFKRQEGYEILSDLAERGYTPAAEMLATSYTYKAIESRAKEDTQLAKKWAITAAQQGQIAPLHALLFKTSLLEESDMSAEVKLLENMDKNTSLPWLAESLSQFNKEHGQAQKATKWATIAGQKEFKEPVCTTITPWRGY